MFGSSLAHIGADALIPEQLPGYVHAVSGRKAGLCQGHVVYTHEGHAVLAAFPGSGEYEREAASSGGEALRLWRERARLWASAPGADGFGCPPAFPQAAPLTGALEELAVNCRKITVLAPFCPSESPPGAFVSGDLYWQIPLPVPAPGVKLRNMLRRAERELQLAPEAWGADHQALVLQYLGTRPLSQGTRSIFSALPVYVGGGAGDGLSGTVLLLAARRADGTLAAFAVGDFSGLSTAFYMFAFRSRDAPPGASDLLLWALAEHGTRLGHQRLNLGLGINSGISFFKKKWQAEPLLPYVECSWDLRPAPGRA
ncbi:GNAT family N-acetyltransferase, partial [Desulfovibrio sp. OttesenSCG-928-A18]|nr:GNAT family N-acetyltransferase [Desulfovibrio sp. OttesenSCG-928-A18]